jgi:DNA helicase-2/ATP-dependent DNA helicase PcrA
MEKWSDDFSLVVKTERPFEFEFQKALISGAIDMLKRENDDGSFLEVIDFKTGKADNDLMHRYELQLQLYTIAAREALGIDTRKAQIHFIDTDKNSRLAIDTSDAALDVAREELNYAIEGISHTRFTRDARQNKICNDCDWKSLCPKRKGYRYE